MSAYGKANNARTVRLITDAPGCSGSHGTLESLFDCADCMERLTTYED